MKPRVKNPKPPFQLFQREEDDFTVVPVWVCGECGMVTKEEKWAEECCKIRVCECGKDVESASYTACEECRRESSRIKEEQQWQNMPIYENYTSEPLFDGTYYHSDFGEYLDQHCDDGPDDLDEYLEVCEVKKIGYNVEPYKVLDYIREEALDCVDFEDEGFNGEDDLIKAIKEFKEKQTTTFFVPTGKKIVVKDLLPKSP